MEKSTGIVRKTDELGRIVIPKELRETLGIEEGTPLEIFTKGSEVIFKKYTMKNCNSCGQALNDNDKYCSNCGKKVETHD